MPSVQCDFCNDGFEWVANVILQGGELHYLCSETWHGTCINIKNAHTFYCARHFHTKRFTIPLCHHAEAFAVFQTQTERSDVKGQLSEYAARICAVYPLGDVITFAARTGTRALRPHIARALRMKTKPEHCTLSALQFVTSANAEVVPRDWLPRQMEDLVDHAETSMSVLLASSYLAWLRGVGRIHPEDFPALATMITQALSALPCELHRIVTRHLYAPRCLCSSQI